MFLDNLNAKGLNINTNIACLLKDSENFLDQYDNVNINTNLYVAAPEVHKALMAKGANINSSKNMVMEVKGSLLQQSGKVTVDEKSDYAGQFVIVDGDIIVSPGGENALQAAEQVIVSGKLYYPESVSAACFNNVTGDKAAYPDEALLLFGKQTLKDLLSKVSAGAQKVYVAGAVTDLEDETLAEAKGKGLQIICGSIMARESQKAVCSSIFQTGKQEYVPDGYEILGNTTLNKGTAALYGPRIYVRGSLLLEGKEADCLSMMESIIVKGKASIPMSCAAAFRAVGKADSYDLYEGTLYNINGIDTINHDRLAALVAKGECLTVAINGVALFDEDVLAEDMDAIAKLSYNGIVLIPGAAQGALSSKIAGANGVMISLETAKSMTGMSLPEIMAAAIKGNGGGANVNTSFYLLV